LHPTRNQIPTLKDTDCN